MAKVKQTKKMKGWMIALCCVLAVIVAFSSFLLIWFFGDSYRDFDSFEESTAIPGLDESFRPQGIETTSSYMFITGYMNNGDPSRIYIIQNYAKQNPTVKYVTMENSDGTPYVGHCCGIATSAKSSTSNAVVWVVSRNDAAQKDSSAGSFQDGYVYTLSYTALRDADNGDVIKLTSKKKVPVGGDFCYYDNTEKEFIVGDFYRKGNYETHISKADGTYKTESTNMTNALYVTYDFDSTNTNSSKLSNQPTKVVSIPDQIQGLCITGSGSNRLFTVSQSYGLKNSHLLVYSEPTEQDGTVTLAKTQNTEGIPLYHLNADNQVNDYEIPSMSEGLSTYNSRVYVLFESAAVGYKTFTRQQLKNVYTFTPAKKEN